jgi:hypothetical protein
VSASQQIGGALGTALLSMIAASALSGYITSSHAHPGRPLLSQAAVRGDTTAFAWAVVTFAGDRSLTSRCHRRGPGLVLGV